MGVITDEMILDAVRGCGTATAPMIYDWLQERVDLPRDVISSRSGKKLKQLVKYRMVSTMSFQKRTWYYMPDTIPDPIPLTPVFGTDRIKECVDRMPNGGVITVNRATEIGNCTKAHARRTLAAIGCLKHDYANVYCKECI